MGIEFDFDISFDDVAVKKFLNDDKALGYAISPTLVSGFDEEPDSSKPSGEPKSVMQDVIFLRKESYQLTERGVPTGVHTVVVAVTHEVQTSVEYWLFFKSGLSEDGRAHGRRLLQQYDEASGADPISWMRANLDDKLTEDDFLLLGAAKLEKYVLDPSETDISQRLRLFEMFGVNGTDDRGQTNLDIVGEYPLHQWGKDRDVDLKLISVEPVFDDSEPSADTLIVSEVDKPSDLNETTANAKIDEVLRKTQSDGCGPVGNMRKETFSLLSLAVWPEFKIVWERIRVKIGCSTISMKIPTLRVRTSKLRFYAYFSYPRGTPQFFVKICETCLIRSALAGSVIAIVTSNPAAGISSLTPMFKRCIQEEIRECVSPGIYVLKHSTPWK